VAAVALVLAVVPVGFATTTTLGLGPAAVDGPAPPGHQGADNISHGNANADRGAANRLSRRPTGKLVPSRGALLGGYISPDAARWRRTNITAREAQLGRKLNIDHRYYAWGQRFPTADDAWDVRNGRIPLITWEPWHTTLDAIDSGADDAMIGARAAAVATFGKPVFLRWGHEMNGNWYPWAGTHSNTPGATDGPAKYVAAWRHIHHIFSAAGATNAVWVWSPNWANIPDQPWNAHQRYYPGDGYVDWVCIDGYNRDASSWKSFTSIFSPVYRTYHRRKPIMIGETASVEGRPGQKAQWVADARRAIRSTFPSIAALLWFDTTKDGNDWRIDSSASAFAAFTALASDSYFRPRS
jgi:hypothetical protein